MGIFKQLPLHSHTSQYGQLSRFKTIDRKFINEVLEKAYSEISSGEFNKEWFEEQRNGLKNFEALREEAFNCDISKLEDEMRK